MRRERRRNDDNRRKVCFIKRYETQSDKRRGWEIILRGHIEPSEEEELRLMPLASTFSPLSPPVEIIISNHCERLRSFCHLIPFSIPANDYCNWSHWEHLFCSAIDSFSVPSNSLFDTTWPERTGNTMRSNYFLL